jgi:transcriptional regulator with XRE-family HTH domain
VAEGSPTVRRRELGALLRKLREDKGLTVKDVTDHLLCSPSKVSRLETGERGATLRDIRDLCELYGVADEAERNRLVTLAREGKQHGWWQAFELPYSTYVGLEQAATFIGVYHSAVVPGLLQTVQYAKAVHEGGIPKLQPEIIEQRIEERITRQMLLDRDEPPYFSVILDEAILHRHVGGVEAMCEQLDKIISASGRTHTTIQVLPYGVGAHPAVGSDFTILEFPKGASSVPTVVYVESLAGQIYLDRPQDANRYLQVFATLREIALNPEDSLDLLKKLRRAYGKGLRLAGLPPYQG